MNTALEPFATVVLCGCIVIIGAVATRFTVRLATWLVVLPALFERITE